VAVLAVPVLLGTHGPRVNEGSWLRDELRIEAAFMASSREGDLPRTPRVQAGVRLLPRDYVYEIRQVRKEVLPAKPSVRLPASIGS
jgi:hypothetical protein